MAPAGDLLKFGLAIFRTRASACALFCLAVVLLVSPGAVWGALGGRRPLLGELEGILPSIRRLSLGGPGRGLLPPLVRGVGGLV